EAVRLTEPYGATAERMHALHHLSVQLMVACRREEAIELATELEQIAAELDDPGMAANAEITIGSCLKDLGREEEGLARLVGAEPAVREKPGTRLRHVINLSDAYQALGRYDEAVRVARAGMVMVAEV